MKELAIIGMGTMGSAIHALLQNNFHVRGIGRLDDPAGSINPPPGICRSGRSSGP